MLWSFSFLKHNLYFLFICICYPFSFQGVKQRMPFSSISTWVISTSSTRWGSVASVEWSWYGVPRLDDDKKLVVFFWKQAVRVEDLAGRSSIHVFSPLSPANRCSSKARRTKHLPWRSWRSGTSWTPGSRSTSAPRSSSCRRRTLTSSYGVFSASTAWLGTRQRFFFFPSPLRSEMDCFESKYFESQKGFPFFFYSQTVQNIQGQKVPLHVDGSLFRWRAVDDSPRPVSCQNIKKIYYFFCHPG